MANKKDIKGGFAATEGLSLRNRVALVVLVPLFGKSPLHILPMHHRPRKLTNRCSYQSLSGFSLSSSTRTRASTGARDLP